VQNPGDLLKLSWPGWFIRDYSDHRDMIAPGVIATKIGFKILLKD
jgi:hypothetical protein